MNALIERSFTFRGCSGFDKENRKELLAFSGLNFVPVIHKIHFISANLKEIAKNRVQGMVRSLARAFEPAVTFSPVNFA